MGEPAEVARQAGTAPQLQAAHLGIREEAVLGELAAPQRDLGQAAGVPRPSPVDGPRPVAVTGQQSHQHLADREERRLRQYPDFVDPGVVLQDGAELVTSLQRLQRLGVATPRGAGHREGAQTAGHRLAVPHAGVGCDHDAGAGHLAPPRQIEILAHGDDAAGQTP